MGESLLVAALAGMGNVLLTNPIWLIATRMQAGQQDAVQAVLCGAVSASYGMPSCS